MIDISVFDKLNNLKKMIKETSANCGTDAMTEFILLTAIAEVKLRKEDAVNLSEIEMKIDEAILKLRSKETKN